MPVPAPRISKPLAHPVIKKNHSGNLQSNPFQNLTSTLPVSPTGPPPSYGTREEWIESLPSWRRQKPRRIWEEDSSSQFKQPAAQVFTQGLTSADNAMVIKGARAQAYIPPLYNLLGTTTPMGSDYLVAASTSTSEAEYETRFHLPQIKWRPCADDITETRAYIAAPNPSPTSIDTDASMSDAHVSERGAFSPVLEEESPGFASGHDVASSPLEPLTPFYDFIDRAITRSQPPVLTCGERGNGSGKNIPSSSRDDTHSLRNFQSVRIQVVQSPKQPASGQVPDAVPNPATAYKKLTEPLSEWMANYVWKVCTTGYSLPPGYVNSASIPIVRFLDSPPRNLAPSIHSILLSTLLQPSAVFLALWYIGQLPVYCGSIPLGPDHVKELRFRTALFGEPRTSTCVGESVLNLSPMDESIPFRLILLGCMLANKWLDDHTFSNKTWHSISNVPIHTLNELEMLALDLFSYDLSMPSEKWSLWMNHIRSHHISSIPPSHVQPISRPSSNPHLIIRNTIEDILRTRVTPHTSSGPQPVFIGLEQRKKEQQKREQTVDDIDLDEDGPLREEYLPRRRSNGSSIYKGREKVAIPAPQPVSDHVLPPPAKWSPAGDEPILRDRHRTSSNYVAVQPAAFPGWSDPYHMGGSAYHDQAWNSLSNFSLAGYEVPNLQTHYNPYIYAPPVLEAHLRTHSLSHDGQNSQIHGHMRSYSHTSFDYRSNEVAAYEAFPRKETDHIWFPTSHYPYAPPAYMFHPSAIHQPTWVRT